jgi:predicted dehydrogenase
MYAVASRTPEKAKAFEEEHGAEHAFNYNEIVNCQEIDVIYVATTHHFHFGKSKT